MHGNYNDVGFVSAIGVIKKYMYKMFNSSTITNKSRLNKSFVTFIFIELNSLSTDFTF